MSDVKDDREAVASHTLAYLRSHSKKLDLILETLARHNERLGRVERDIGEVRRDVGEGRRDVLEIKSDMALMENKILSAQTEMLTILYRMDQLAAPPVDELEPATPGPTSSKG